MKILFIAPRFHTNQFELINFLSKKHKVYFLSQYLGHIENYNFLRPTICKGKFIPLNFDFKNINFSRALYLPNIFFLKKYLKFVNPDLIIIRHHNKLFSYICLFFLKLSNKKVILYDQNEITLNTKEKPFFNKIWFLIEFIFRTYVLNVPWVSPINNYRKNKILKNCYFLPFALKKKFKKNTVKKIVNLLSIGKFQKRKNLIMLCKSIKILREKKRIKLKLTIIGQVKNLSERKYYNQVKNYIKLNDLENHISLKINVPHKKIAYFYRKSNLFVLPSSNEPAAISPLESASYGRPVIISDTSGTRCYFKNNYDSKFFKNNNVYDLSKKIYFFVKYPNKLLIFSRNIIKRFDSTISLKNYNNYFNELLKKI